MLIKASDLKTLQATFNTDAQLVSATLTFFSPMTDTDLTNIAKLVESLAKKSQCKIKKDEAISKIPLVNCPRDVRYTSKWFAAFVNRDIITTREALE